LLLRPLQESPRSPFSWQKKIVWQCWRRDRLTSEHNKREPTVSPPSLSVTQCLKAGWYFRDAESSVVVRWALVWIITIYDYNDYSLVRCDQLSALSEESILVAARSKVWFYGPSLFGIVGSNPARWGMGVCLEWCVLLGRSLCEGADRLWRGSCLCKANLTNGNPV
jgi:hypothetical protein